jgi:glycosyltransferase involved in cell wall biosynthesis
VTPTICVALPVYNGADFMGEAIESILAQEGVDLTVRIRDNGSTDDSVAIAERYAAEDPRLSFAVNEENVFYFGSLNRVLHETDADLFVPFAHDDVMQPGNLATKVAALERHEAAWAHSRAFHIDEHGTVNGYSPDISDIPEVLDPPGLFTKIAPHNRVWPQSVLARTDILRAVGGFDARSLYAGDWLTWLRLSLRHRVVTLQEPLIAYRVHSESGHLQSNASGFNGRDVPATLDHVFRDPAMPAELVPLRDAMVASIAAATAHNLHRDGIRRVSDGWAGYMTVGRALARQPGDNGLRGLYYTMVGESGLTAPGIPLDGVTSAPGSAADAAALAAAVAELGALLERLAIAVYPDRVDEAMALLEPHFGETELDVAVVPTQSPAELYRPGRIVLARWGSDAVAEAEAAGLPVYPYAMPDPFADPPDPDKWETVDPDATLV